MSATNPLIPTTPSLDNTLGATLIGVLVCTLLYGLTTAQVFNYYQHSGESDNAFMRYVIFLLWIIDSAHLALLIHAIYFYSVSSFNNPIALITANWSLVSSMPTGSASDLLVSVVYTSRLWKFPEARLAVPAIAVSIIVSLGASTAVTVLAVNIKFTEFTHRFSYLWYMAFGGQAVADIIITIALITLLKTQKPTTRRSRINSVVSFLTVHFVNTCVLTTSCAIATIIACATMPNNLIFVGISSVKPKLMLNSMLALLNSREALRDIGKNDFGPVRVSELRASGYRSGAHLISPNKTQTYGTGSAITDVGYAI